MQEGLELPLEGQPKECALRGSREGVVVESYGMTLGRTENVHIWDTTDSCFLPRAPRAV